MKENLPDRRKHGYAELEQKIDDQFEALEERLAGYIRKGIVAFSIIGLGCAVAIFGFGFVVKRQGKTSDQIQTQRFDSLVQSCSAQNKRHDRTILKSKAKLPPEFQNVVILLVNELQPFVEDCSEAARKRVRG